MYIRISDTWKAVIREFIINIPILKIEKMKKNLRKILNSRDNNNETETERKHKTNNKDKRRN